MRVFWSLVNFNYYLLLFKALVTSIYNGLIENAEGAAKALVVSKLMAIFYPRDGKS